MGKKDSKKMDYKVKPMGVNCKRGCTDLPFLLLFIVFWGGMYLIAGVAITNGDPTRLIVPQDSHGQFCGLDNSKLIYQNSSSNMNLTNKPYLYFLNPFELQTSLQICVEKCPNQTAIATFSNTICNYNHTRPKNLKEFILDVSNHQCNWFFYASSPVLQRCVPANISIPEVPVEMQVQLIGALGFNYSTIKNSGGMIENNKEISMKVFQDIVLCKWIIIIGTLSTVVVCFAYLLLLRIIGKVVIWITILFTNIVLIGFSVWLYFYLSDYYSWYNSIPAEYKTDNDKYELYGIATIFGITAITALVIFCITVFLRKRIKIAIEIIKESAKAIAAMPLIIFFPFWNFLLSMCLYAYFAYVYLYIITPTGKVSISSFGYSFTHPDIYEYIKWYHIFGCLWGVGFLSGINQVTFSGAIATYYWTLDKSKMPFSPIIGAFYRTVRYHLGTICVGSLLLAIVQTIRVFLQTLKKQAIAAKKMPGMSFIFCCADCCLSCIEKIVKWINKHAYIQCAVNGTNFCVSAFHAFGLLLRNGLRVIAINFVSSFVLFLGKLSITAGVVFGTWQAIKWKQSELNMTYTFVPALIVGVVSYYITAIFLSVYDSAIDTIFMCFLEDDERNDGSLEKPYYYSDNLKKITGHKNAEVVVSTTIKEKN